MRMLQSRKERQGIMLKWGAKRLIYQGKEWEKKMGHQKDYSIKKDITDLGFFSP